MRGGIQECWRRNPGSSWRREKRGSV